MKRTEKAEDVTSPRHIVSPLSVSELSDTDVDLLDLSKNQVDHPQDHKIVTEGNKGSTSTSVQDGTSKTKTTESNAPESAEISPETSPSKSSGNVLDASFSGTAVDPQSSPPKTENQQSSKTSAYDQTPKNSPSKTGSGGIQASDPGSSPSTSGSKVVGTGSSNSAKDPTSKTEEPSPETNSSENPAKSSESKTDSVQNGISESNVDAEKKGEGKDDGDKIEGETTNNESVVMLTASKSKVINFHLFTKDSYVHQVKREKEEKLKEKEKHEKAQEAHLKGGVLLFGDEEPTEGPPKPDPALVEGNQLLNDYGILPTAYIGKPLEEIDPVIVDKTFVVIGKKIKKRLIYRFSSTPSFYLLPPWNPVRKLAVRICTNQFFDYFVILTILINCVFLAIPELSIAETSEYVFFVIYFLEMILKIVARGFVMQKYTYLRDPWNWLDFGVIVLATVTLVFPLGNVQGLRTFRVLRALKTVSIVPGLKTIVNALLRAFKMLVDVLMLTLFCLMVFALFGLQVYRGLLRNKCVADFNVSTITPSDNLSVTEVGYLYNEHIRNSSNWLDEDGTYVLCGNTSGAGGCPSGYICLPDIGENPNHGYTNYDHFGWAMLNAFQLITLDFWEDNYDKVIRAGGPWNVVFFVLVVFFGSFYLINLMLAVVALSYEEEAESAGAERERERKASEKKKKSNPIYDLSIITIANKRNQRNRQGGKDRNNSRRPSHWPKIAEVRAKQTAVGNPKKPMTKKPSKDSGFSENMKGVKPSRSMKHQDSREILRQPEDADFTSMSSGSEPGIKRKDMLKKFLIKQDSQGNVSSSSVVLERGSTQEEGSMISDYSQDTTVDIIKPGEQDDPDEMMYAGQLVDRNCDCCSRCWRCGFVPWVKFQGYIFIFVSDPLFDLFITLCILVNTIVMATEHHNMSELTAETIRYANYVMTAVFTLEAILKLTAFSKYYFKSGWNVFDLVIVIASLIDLQLEGIDGLAVFRTFRLLRVFKLAQSWPTMRLLISIIVNTFGALGNLTVILGIIIYIFAVSGLQLFNKSYKAAAFDPDPKPRWNFDDFFHAFMMIFRVLCGEWIEPLWDCMRVENELCMVIFLPALVIGNFMVLNLFLALLLNAFATDSLKKHKESSKVEESRLKLAFQRIKNLCCCCLVKKKKMNTIEPDVDERGEEENGSELKEKISEEEIKSLGNGEILKDSKSDKTISNGEIGSTNKYTNMKAVFDTTAKREKFASFETAVKGLNMEIDVEKGEEPAEDGAKGVVSKSDIDIDGLTLGDTAAEVKESPVINDCLPVCCSKRINCLKDFNKKSAYGRVWFRMRQLSVKIVDNKFFESVVLFVIFFSSVTLAFEDVYLDERPELKEALQYLNITFCVLFSIEMLFKWFAYGLKKYFSAFWTVLDFLIVLISIASLIAESLGISNLTAFRSLRTLRALRPLRAVSRLASMRIVVNALMLAIPAIVNVLLVCVVFWLIFSIMGVQFFAGKFYKCLDADGERILASIIPNKTECLRQNYTWRNSNINFDDCLQGFLALFQVATFEGWMEVMRDAVDATDIDQQPQDEYNINYYLYFVAFIIFGSFFTLNLIIGVIIDNFNVLKKQYDGSYLDMFLTTSQRNYYNTLKKLGNKKPQKTIKRPKTKFQAFFFDIATSNKFELCIIIIIFINMITMAVEYYNQPQIRTDILKILNIVFTVIFILECIIKLIGMRWHYFRQFWNVFDFIIVLLSIVGLILDDIQMSVFVTPTLLRVVRVFRIGRVLRLIKAAKGIRKLLFALIISLPAIFNIGALLCLLMYIYAIIGMSSFGNLKLTGVFDDIVNFQTFANSFMLLFRVATSAGWNEVLDPMLIAPPDCDPEFKTLPNGTRVRETNGECGVSWLAVIFMVSYIFIAYLVVINMYIAVILENFNQAHQQEEVGITEDDFDMFYAVWERYDPLATQFIKYDVLSDFLADLEEPLGLPKPNEIAIVAFDLPITEGDKLHCLDILMALVKKHLGAVDETEESIKFGKQMESKFEAIFPSRVQTTKKSSTMRRKMEDVAARTLQRNWRSYKTSRALKNITNLAMQQKSVTANASASRANSIISLGRRLSNALTSFFSSSRPSSAISRVSLRSNTSRHTLQPISKQTKISNTLKVPSINTLYPSASDYDPHHSDFEL